jgi:flagellin-like protein
MDFTQLKQLFTDEDAVSPVIGVILMVAITVILAAVIGTFVLGLGENVQDSAPQANFQFEYGGGADGTIDETADDYFNITHTGGEDVDADNVKVLVDGSEPASGQVNTWDDTTISTGTTYSVDETKGSQNVISGGETIRVVWTSPSGGTSNTIGQSTVPS